MLTDRGQARLRREALERAWAAFLSGEGSDVVRAEVLESWRRTHRVLSPLTPAAPPAVSAGDPSPLLQSVHILEREFSGTPQRSGLIASLADASGRIVWTFGDARLLRIAEKSNFAPGAMWDEPSMGINGISMALALEAPASVWSAEHWLSSLHDWSCHAAPIRHPRAGRILGVLNFATRWDREQPLVSTAAVALAGRLAPEIAAHSEPTQLGALETIELTVLGARRTAIGDRVYALSKRQTEILLLLALRPDGIALEELHADLYGDAAVGMATLKAEVCHLRRIIGGRISRTPYRLHGPIRVDALDLIDDLRAGRLDSAAERFAGPLLPWSDSPRITRLARTVEVALREAALGATDVDAVMHVAGRLDQDAQLFEHALEILPPGDGRRHIMRGHLLSIA